MSDLVPVIALVALLVTVYRHPPAYVEALVAVVAAAAVLATGVLGEGDLTRERRHLVPVVLFLIAILVVAECCRASGLFAAIGGLLGDAGSPTRMFGWIFLAATVTTVVLSLDATVVLLTPVVLAAAAATGLPPGPGQLLCVRLANTASLLLPVSNLTNLIALGQTPISFGRFAALMAPVWLLALAVEYVVVRVRFADELAPTETVPDPVRRPLPLVPLIVVAVMLAGFAAGSLVDLDPAWVAGAAALALLARGLARRELGIGGALTAAQLPFALFVLSLGLVVAALGDGPLGARLDDLVPSGHGLAAMLGIALIGAVLANLVNNLPATLLLVPLVAAGGVEPVLALLVGINLGSGMTWTGSLANLLWRRTVRAHDGVVNSRDFHLVGLVAGPLSIVGGTVLLHLWSGIL